jgi:hypothetical protein
MATVTRAKTVEQLDLFADLDAAAAAEAKVERQRIFDQAPSMFGDATARGFFARVEAMRAWDETYGHFDCLRRSHGWRDEIGGHGFGRGRVPCSDVCPPITLVADLRCNHYEHDCCCVGDLVYRGACLHCDWEGEIRDDHNGAVEDAQDHAWPGWRDLPIVPRRPEPGTNARQMAAMARWVGDVNAVYPDGWLEGGGPIRTVRGYYGTRHVPNHTGFGGYDLCGEVEPEPIR